MPIQMAANRPVVGGPRTLAEPSVLATAMASRVEAEQHAQARAENTFSRYKRPFGSRLRARNETVQRNEALTGCRILTRMTELGMPRSERVATV